jgi:thiamine-monophosphate kinase
MNEQNAVRIGGEFALIRQFFTQQRHHHPQVTLGVGDDAAIFGIAIGHQCVVSSDMLVEGRHFFIDAAPYDLGHKALAVNLSDMAAMGAEPIGFTLSLALPDVGVEWLSDFSAGLFALAAQHHCDLIGGDTTRSDTLVINITVFGQVPTGQAIRRSGAQEGDDIWVSGTLGTAAYALDILRNTPQSPFLMQIRHHLERPVPRVELGLALRDIANAMLDISDGLAGDLLHVLRASNVSAQVDVDVLPLEDCVRLLPTEQALRYALTGGDDYELCFTAPVALRAQVQNIAERTQKPLTRVGCIQEGAPKIHWQSTMSPQLLDKMQDWTGYNHFAT